MSDNMNIWDAVSKTDPSHTKHVNQRGGFTAIGANYQIMSATKQFGPVGEGWGYTAGEPIFQGGTVIVPVTMWHGDRSNVFGPEYGCEKFGGDRIDTDAPKKATTDALTKLLSRLGFNADVFLGKFDDNKYVQQVNQEFRQEERKQQEQQRDPQAIAKWLSDAIAATKTKNDLDAFIADDNAKHNKAWKWLCENAEPEAKAVDEVLQMKRAAFENFKPSPEVDGDHIPY